MNDAGDADAGPNNLQNFPVIQTALLNGGNLTRHRLGAAGIGDRVLPRGRRTRPASARARSIAFSATEGSGSDADATSSTYGPGAVNGVVQGTDTTNRFSFTVATPGGVSAGVALTATARLAGSTSEFSAALVVAAAPAYSFTKVSSAISDPVNCTTPGQRRDRAPRSARRSASRARSSSTRSCSATRAALSDANSVRISDPIPANTALRVADIAGAGTGPLAFANGATSSGLTYTFTSLASATDDVEFSKDGGTTWTYTPVPGADGCDPPSQTCASARRAPSWPTRHARPELHAALPDLPEVTGVSRRSRRFWGVVAALVLLGLASSGCSLANLVRMPGDLVAAARSRPITRGSSLGPVEAELYRASDEKGVAELFLIDTQAEKNDLKLRARHCDEGDEPACGGRLAALFLHNLSRRELAVSLLERACSASDGDACFQVAVMAEKEEILHANDHPRPKPDERVQVFYDRGCEAGDPRACLEAGTRTWDYERSKGHVVRPMIESDLGRRLAQLDRGCKGGVVEACERARVLVSSPWRGLADPQLFAYYTFLLTFAPPRSVLTAFEGGPRPPFASEIAAAIRRSRETEPERWAQFTDIDRTRAERVARYRASREYLVRLSTIREFAMEADAEDIESDSTRGG